MVQNFCDLFSLSLSKLFEQKIHNDTRHTMLSCAYGWTKNVACLFPFKLRFYVNAITWLLVLISLQISDIKRYQNIIIRTVNSCNCVFWIQIHGNGEMCYDFFVVVVFHLHIFNSNYHCYNAGNHNLSRGFFFSFSPLFVSR